MIRSDSNDRLVQALGADLTPVRRLARPGLRVLIWLAVVGVVACALATVSDVGTLIRRLTVAPEMWLAVTGSILTAVLASVAAFQLSLPDRKASWALLPLPAVLLWIGASGVGCLRSWTGTETYVGPDVHAQSCLFFILGLSLPLSLLLFVMLRRGFSLRPNLTAIIGGLACAATAAALLNLFHPYDVAATDISVHALAVAIVILANTIFGGRLLTGVSAS
jgi:hypothetical protein